MAKVKFQMGDAKMAVLDPDGLRDASGQVFYNTSKFTLKNLLGNRSRLEANFENTILSTHTAATIPATAGKPLSRSSMIKNSYQSSASVGKAR